jgi:hypothetical protein
MEHSLKINNMKSTTKKTIDKYQLFTQEVIDMLKAKNGKASYKEIFSIVKKHKVSFIAIQCMIFAKIIERIDDGYFKVNVDKIEPIHARKIIEKRSSYAKELKNRKNPNYFESVKKEPLLKQTRTFEIKKKQENKKTISIFWGLIKINY